MPFDGFLSSFQTPSEAFPNWKSNIPATQSDQWLRKITMTISDSSAGGQPINFTPQSTAGSNLPDLRVNFRVQKSTNQSPNLLSGRIYNLRRETMLKAITYKKVELSAGYQSGRFGIIFKGTIVQWKRGKETPVDTYLEIIAGDGDAAYGYDSYTGKWAAGTKNEQIIKDLAGGFKGLNQEISVGQIIAGNYGDQQLLRSSAVNGMIINVLRRHAAAANGDWWIDDGKVNFVTRDKSLSGNTAVLSPKTGLVGMPEVTPQGIQARCLLNPTLKLGGLVKIDSDILSGVPYLPGSQTKLPISPEEQPGGISNPVATFGAQLSAAFTSPTGIYKIIFLEHSGDTRGNPWYSDIVCVALDQAGVFIRSVELPYQRIHGSVGLGQAGG